MPLRHAAALRRLAQRQHVAVIVQPNAGQQRVDLFDHRAVAHMARGAVGRKKRLHLVNAVVRDGLDGHVAHAHLIGVVRPPTRQRRAVHRHAALHAHCRRHPHELRCREKFPRARDGVVVDDARRAQPLHPRGKHRRRGRVGREGIRRMDVVVDVLRHSRRELRRSTDLPQIRQPLVRRRCVQFVENGNVDHRAALSSA